MARRNKKPRLSDLPGQSDPEAPLDGATFLAASQPVLEVLEADLAARAKVSPIVLDALETRHADERARERTAEAFDGWLQALVTQVAAAWLLSCVFVRVLEDHGLIEQNRIAGPGATDSQRQFFALAPSLSEREYLLTAFRELSRLPGVAGIFDTRHNPVWKLTPSAEATKSLLELFRLPDAEAPAFRFGQADTRVLGDLYQDLSEAVRKRFALLQTPRFVESFILDRTLERAIERFGLEETDLIDPTCGSGHFLLGAFERLFDHRLRSQPGLDAREAARLALSAVYGADINPYAVAIARFRLTLAFIEKAGYQKLADVPELPLHVVVADSLLHNPHAQSQSDFKDLDGQSAAAWAGEEFALEDEAAAREVLYRKYAAVVGNPPYITVKDKALRDRYRAMYTSAAGKYSLATPFAERFFQLGKDGGAVGQITANSFMKREFGKKLIQEFLPTVNLDLIVNTSGAYIPGHGTPTVLLFGSAEEPRSDAVHTVLAKRGEPSTPNEPENGEVWTSIADHWSENGFENEYISIAETERASLAEHPWSLAGGGATELKALLEERAGAKLGDLVESIGFMAITGEDDVFARPKEAWLRAGAEPEWIWDFGIGEEVRDWSISPTLAVAFPYRDAELREPKEYPRIDRALWPYRTTLLNRPVFGGKKYRDVGRTYYEFHQVPLDRLRTPLSIAFAFVATHNHFVLDRGGKVFKQTAPIIKLPKTATEDDHLALLAYLNSSTACFWMKQVVTQKGMHNGSESNATPFLALFEFSGTTLKSLPLPPKWENHSKHFARLGLELDRRARERQGLSWEHVLLKTTEGDASLTTAISETIHRRERLRDEMVALQEELDWYTYYAWDFCSRELLDPAQSISRLAPGQRPFEAAILPEDRTNFEWFRWHETHRDSEWRESFPSKQAHLLESRLERLENSKDLRNLEDPKHKRRWRQPSGKAAQYLQTDRRTLEEEADSWLCQLLEEGTQQRPLRPFRARDIVLKDQLIEAALAWQAVFDKIESFVESTLAINAIPFLAPFRYSESGMKKHEQWTRTWFSTREDPPPRPPPKYAQKDFQSSDFWSLRGKLDVPKERFISYPGCESDEDGEPVYGWAGWDHLQRAQALAMLYQNRKTEEGWPKERLIPMLAGLYELLPWLKQWHNDQPDPTYGVLMGDYYEQFIEGERNALGLTKDEITNWRPPKKTKKRRKTKRKKTAAKTSRSKGTDE